MGGNRLFEALLRQPGGADAGTITVQVPAEDAPGALRECAQRYAGQTVERLDVDGAVAWHPEHGFWTGAVWDKGEAAAEDRAQAEAAIATEPGPTREPATSRAADELPRFMGVLQGSVGGAPARSATLEGFSYHQAGDYAKKEYPHDELVAIYEKVWPPATASAPLGGIELETTDADPAL